MVQSNATLRLILALLVLCALGAGSGSVQASPSGHAPHGTVTIDGVTVPDVGPLPTVVPIPSSNLNYTAKIELGKQLYFDGRLSKNNAISCAFCHNPGTGFADPRQTSIGVGGGVGGRQSPTVYNTGLNHVQFWDGRARSLEEQAIGPIHNPVEMAETHEHVVAKLGKIKGYQQQFRAVFGTDVNLQGIAEAIAAYERTVLSTNSAFDKYVLGAQKAMDEAAVRGLALFKGKARCILCHNGPNFTDNQFHNLGVPQVGPMKEDLGRFAVSRAEKDRGAFKTPTLRSITETAPYMHDGAFKTLEEVVEFMDQGGGSNPNLSPLVKPLNLTAEEKSDLVAFLKALAGEPIPFSMPQLPK
ncbi:MAG: cytochrome c peroxidase [Nitrospira sp.]|jgi:cytochrome c peroxidase|uniref:cytochrome-c peroxidase n=1 Tax=Nitrospira sp. ND1 TaxID=1658518 RepID=UPI0009BBEF2C|nr:cytochrome c peroxidase [Nitrospira sp. ND1]MBK7418056.1 c-type cytochrome [Nitrospira sp.]OYT22659.1 MAG: cytochrome-c peroxidase [Nitrospira sp. UW-LDO-02]MBK7484597.1 c-type cytochrome [Nitrospira sp.]MBK9995969.1 c-type cytochrome [Nitrospira sp.]MBP6198183.1 c-type cytochrome [Nitrospira sp.]